jgi:DNA-binding beta-propeller fold protein YncE
MKSIPSSLALVFLFAFSVGLRSAEEHPAWPELKYSPVPDWPALPEGWNLGETASVAVDSNDGVYVFHRGPHPLLQFHSSGKFIRSLLEGMVTSAHGVRLDQYGNIWVVDVKGHTVLKLNPAGRVIMVLGRRDFAGADESHFDQPTDIAIAPNGDFYVTDGYGNSRVMKFSKDGKLLLQWGKKGVAEGEFNLPHSIVLDREGMVYVGDRENNRVQIFSPDGRFLRQWTELGSPWGLAITPAQEIYMADGKNNRVLKLTREGKVLGVLGSPGKGPGQFAYAHHLAVSSQGELFVAEILNWRVQKFVPR